MLVALDQNAHNPGMQDAMLSRGTYPIAPTTKKELTLRKS